MSKGPTTYATTSSKLLEPKEALSTWCHPGMSSYATSKLAAIKLGEFLDLGKPPKNPFQRSCYPS